MKIEEEINQTKPFKTPQIKAVVNLLFTSSWLTSEQSRKLKPFGISIQQYNILRILRGIHPKPASVKLLIERMLDKTSNASRLVAKLKKKGLVERTACPEDRRRVDVVINEQGLALLEEVSAVMEESEKTIGLTNEEALQLSNLLDKMRT